MRLIFWGTVWAMGCLAYAGTCLAATASRASLSDTDASEVASQPLSLSVPEGEHDEPALAGEADEGQTAFTPPSTERESPESDAREVAEQSTELIQQRDRRGALRQMRRVALDSLGNYVNHGLWRQWNSEGKLEFDGQYRLGEPHGFWTHWITPEEETQPLSPALHGFQAPFLSQAEFHRGRLHGQWVIFDANQTPCVSVQFVYGKRHGEALWYAPDGTVSRRETYVDGQLEGEVVVTSPASGESLIDGPYLHGYLLTPKVMASHEVDSARKKAEGQYAMGPAALDGVDDFWTNQLASIVLQDHCVPHGEWQNWYPSGQLKVKGQYALGQPTGTFAWWHANGQKAVAGIYRDGQAVGTWTWWDDSGQRIAQREFPVTPVASREGVALVSSQAPTTAAGSAAPQLPRPVPSIAAGTPSAPRVAELW
ncbi:MAG: hypothetical protein KDA61_11695 [Planctomycetales bacterium]|nr:hypothetical protein [Planctomycetales bacterium]